MSVSLKQGSVFSFPTSYNLSSELYGDDGSVPRPSHEHQDDDRRPYSTDEDDSGSEIYSDRSPWPENDYDSSQDDIYGW